ncbi:MAG TPA: efflux RND transporter periplasmic adaptor subunit [Xanthomonadales bacterium]|nr:efflux RND transporter periplasmic adaptor subunit [Xanthomonadales bacterium]
MKKFLRYTLPLGIIILSLVVVFAMVAVSKGKRPERKDSGPKALLVDVIPVKLESMNLVVESQGSVQPRTETVLVAEVAGKVISVSRNFVAGGFFKQGEVLLRIDPSDYDTALKRAQANLASKQAQYADQKARSDQALKDWSNLGRTGEPSDLTLRKPQLAEALAAVKSAEADLQKAQRDLDKTSIKAPYDGLVRSKQVDIGQYVSPGTSLGVSFAIDKAEIRLPIAIGDLKFLQLPSATGNNEDQHTPVLLSAEGSGLSGQWQAEIVRTEGVIDQNSRVIYAVAEVIDPYSVLGLSQQAELRMGTFVRAEIEGIWQENIVSLPRLALREGNTVLVASPENELEIRKISIIRAQPEEIIVSDGLKSGDRVIITALEAPIPGTKLSISGDPEPASNDEQSKDLAGLESTP